MMLVDLHCHSTASDGSFSPERVAQEMAAAGVRYAALTDHNSTAGQEPFRAVLEQQGVTCITGAELSVHTPESPFHLLAYGFDPNHARLANALQIIRNPLGWFSRRWARNLRSRFQREGALECSSKNEDVSDLHFIQGRLDFHQAVAMIHQAGGLAIMAHPVTRMSFDQLANLLRVLPGLGLDGIEAFYQPYSPETCQRLLGLAEEHHLLVTAGSDYHGPYSHHGTHPGMEIPEIHLQRFLLALRR